MKHVKVNIIQKKLEIKCKCGKTFLKSFHNFKDNKQRQCKECGIKKLSDAHKGKKPSEETIKKISEANKGKKHPGWKGGISPINIYLRDYIKSWKIYSMKYSDYKSVISEKPFKHIHHVNKQFFRNIRINI